MGFKVCKFGGSSLADGKAVQAVSNVLKRDGERRYILPSAPGKRFQGDVKVTDLLYAYFRFCSASDKRADGVFEEICARFEEIADPFGLSAYAREELLSVRKELTKSEAYCASRGEWLTAKILSKGWDLPFVDAEQLPLFQGDGFDKTCFSAVRGVLKPYPKAVVPAFYGVNEKGEIKTFSRGGGDVSGAIIARALSADLYENWTDVSGVYECDPKIVRSAKRIPVLSYRELAEFSRSGACVLHGETLSVLDGSKIPVYIVNTFAPEKDGTLVVPSDRKVKRFLGVACKKEGELYKISLIGKGNEAQRRRLLSLLRRKGVSFVRVEIRDLSIGVLLEKRFYQVAIKEIYKEFFG